MLFVLKTTYLIMCACAEPCRADLPDLPTLAETCHTDSPDSPTLAELCCADSPDSQTLAKGHFREKCDSPQQIRASNARVSIPYNIIYLFLLQFPQVIDHLLHCWLHYWQQHLPYVVVVVQVMFPFF